MAGAIAVGRGLGYTTAMTTLVYTHRSSLRHDAPGHPERIDRIKAVNSVLESPHFAAAARREAPRAIERRVLLAHSPEHVQRIFGIAPEGASNISTRIR